MTVSQLSNDELKNPKKIAKFIRSLRTDINSIVFDYIYAEDESYVLNKRLLNDEIDAGILFDASLRRTITQVIYSLETWSLFITTKECEDNTTNITADVIEAILKVVKWVTRYDDNIKHLM